MKHIKGNLINLLKSGELNVILQSNNCKKTHGSGLALAIKSEWPQVFAADFNSPLSGSEKFGRIIPVEVEPQKYVICLFNQFNYGSGRQVDYEKLYTSLEEAKKFIETLELEVRIGAPKRLSSDRAGGDWRIVEKVIECVFEDFDATIVEL